MSSKFKRTMFGGIIDNEVSDLKSGYLKLLSKLWKFSKSKLITRYGYSIEIKDAYKINIINNYLREIDKDFNKRNISDNGLLNNTSVILPVEENTFIYVIAGDPLSDSTKDILSLVSESDHNTSISISNKLKLYIYGKYSKRFMNIIKSKITKKSTSALKIFNISSSKDSRNDESFQSIISDMKPREIDTLFYDYGIKESVLSHIDGFFNSKSLYEEKNINYKTSILLYGPPGTGKSSLAKALCNKYNIDMVLVDMNTFDKLDVNTLTQCINGDDKTYMILIEDIDTIFNLDRDNNTVEKDDKKVINKLLQFLDSNTSPNNVIFICTTNHIEKLDEAIKRKGRIDKNVYIGPINKDIARNMCKSFDLKDEDIDSILSNYGPNGEGLELVNQSSLQNDILNVFKSYTIQASGDINEEKAMIESVNSKDDNQEIASDCDDTDTEPKKKRSTNKKETTK